MNKVLNGKIKYILFSSCCLFLCFIVLLTLNKFGSESNENKQSATNTHALSTINSTKKTDLPLETNVLSYSGSIVGYSIPEMMERSSLIVYGEVAEIFETIAIEDVNGGIVLMTEMTITPIETFRGDTQNTITVRLLGGHIGNRYDEYAEVPEFQRNDHWLLFLYQPNVGGSQNTEGDYYYLSGLYQGAFKEIKEYENDEETFEAENIKFVNAMQLIQNDENEQKAIKATQEFETTLEKLMPIDTMFSIAELREELPAFNEEKPIDPDIVRKEALDAYKSNLNNEMCTQEEYDLWVSQLDQYAEIISEERFEELENTDSYPDL